MTARKKASGTRKSGPAHGLSADDALEFIFNDEEEALSSDELALTHQREMPALQEFLREMSELDSRGPCPFLH